MRTRGLTAWTRTWGLLVLLVGLYSVGISAAFRWSPDWTAMQTWAIALTGFAIIWYTWETMRLRLTALQQRELQLRPLVVLEPQPKGFLVRNLGHGVALNIEVENVVVSEKEEVVIRFPRLIPFLPAGATAEVVAESFKRDKPAGDFFLAQLSPEYAHRDLQVRLRFQNAEMARYTITESIRPGELRIAELSTRGSPCQREQGGVAMPRKLRGLVLWILTGLRRTLLIAGLIGFLDAFVLNQGAVAVMVALGALVGGIPRAIVDRPHARLRLARTAIYVAMAIVVIAANVANAQLARHRADALIASCRQYEVRHGRLPDRLEDLVPEFIRAVPAAKYTLGPFNQFWYDAHDGHHTLMWIALPPFGRPYYVFEENRWGYLD